MAVQLGANLRHGAVSQARNIVIPAYTVFDEDCSFADGHPTDHVINLPNANIGQSVVASGVRLGQVIYWLKTNYLTITAEKQRMIFGSAVQGSDPVGHFYSKLCKLARLAGIDEQQIRLQFLHGISSDNQLEIRCIGINRPVFELLTELEEIERYKAEQLSGAYLYSNSDSKKAHRKDNYSDMTETEVRNLIKSITTPAQTQPVSSQLVSQKIQPTQPSKAYYGPQPPEMYQTIRDTNIEFIPIPKPDLPPKPIIKKSKVDSDEELANHISKLSINAVVNKAMKKAMKTQHRCLKCNKIGHRSNSPKCLRNKKKSQSRKKGSVNKVFINSNSDTNYSSSSDSGSDSSDNKSESEKSSSEDAYIPKLSSKKKSSPKKLTLQKKSDMIIDSQIQKIILAMFNDLEPAKSDFINYQELAPEIPESNSEEETLNDPIKIDFVRRKEPITSLATIPVKIKCLKIPALVLDNEAEPLIISENIVKHVNWPIDKSEKYNLSGVAIVPTESIGIACNFPITFPSGFTIRKDFVVVYVSKPTLIFSNPLLKKYKCAIDWGKDELKIPFNRKDHIILVTMHKVKNNLEVNCATTSQNDRDEVPLLCNKPLVSDQISQEADSNESDNDPLEEWHAPAGFRLDSDNLTLKKNV
ncbi:3603_t:CDS:2 [Cetraspora pellucida]|uniref:3603_t:CDS:1 n=1 Tax=Cetraspora pellucida TaxID=1433469 RepID=A0A9N8W964_9GLOM|nr:3603_t:CDS:2 [Cetraspora pellucida]